MLVPFIALELMFYVVQERPFQYGKHFCLPSGNTQNMSDLVAAAGLNRRSVTPGSIQGNDGSFATPSSGVTSSGRNSVSPHPQAATPPPTRPPLKINIPSRGSAAGQMVG